MSSNRGHRAGQCAPDVPRTRIRARGDLQELHRRSGGSLIIHRIPAPRPCNSLIRRRYGGGVGNRCRWAERFAMSEQRQSMERHFQRSRELFRTDRGRPYPREWEDPQAKRCGGMERSGSLCGRVAAPRETLHRVPWREPLQQLWKATCRQGASSGSSCRQG